jgi:hypothetical protein
MRTIHSRSHPHNLAIAVCRDSYALCSQPRVELWRTQVLVPLCGQILEAALAERTQVRFPSGHSVPLEYFFNFNYLDSSRGRPPAMHLSTQQSELVCAQCCCRPGRAVNYGRKRVSGLLCRRLPFKMRWSLYHMTGSIHRNSDC